MSYDTWDWQNAGNNNFDEIKLYEKVSSSQKIVYKAILKLGFRSKGI